VDVGAGRGGTPARARCPWGAPDPSPEKRGSGCHGTPADVVTDTGLERPQAELGSALDRSRLWAAQHRWAGVGGAPGGRLVGVILVVFGVIALADAVIPGAGRHKSSRRRLLVALAPLLIGSMRRSNGEA